MDAHIIDSRGVYIRTEEVDPMGAQPAGAVYADLPLAQVSHVRMWMGNGWTQVSDLDVPQFPEVFISDPVPLFSTRRQGLLALLGYGIKPADIQSEIDSITDEMERIAAQIEYEANTWERASGFVENMWARLGGNPSDLDELFRTAVKL